MDEYRRHSDVFEADILETVKAHSSADGRNSVGGSSVAAARAGIRSIKKRLKQFLVV